MKLPRGQGIWPAFWMLGDSITQVGWPACGEIDIVEVLGHENSKLHGTIHGRATLANRVLAKPLSCLTVKPSSDAYHIFAMDRSPGKIEWSVDGRVYHVCTPAACRSETKWVFDEAPFHLILNLAVGGHWPGYPRCHHAIPAGNAHRLRAGLPPRMSQSLLPMICLFRRVLVATSLLILMPVAGAFEPGSPVVEPTRRA